MAGPETKRGLELLLYREEDTPGTWTFACGITSKQVPFTRNLSETTLPDCDDPTATPWVVREAISRSGQITGDGVMAMEFRAKFQADYDSDAGRRWRAVIVGEGYWQGLYQMAGFTPGAAEGDAHIKLSIDLQSSGAVAWTDDATAGT